MKRPSPPLIVFGTLFALVWAAVVLVFAVDPLGVLPWGPAPKLGRDDYPAQLAPRIIAAVAADPSIDVVLVGGSTATRVSRALLNRQLSASNAINVSYAGTRPADRALVMERIARQGRFKRVIVMLDWGYADLTTRMREGFPAYLYDDGVLNKLHMVGADTVIFALQRLSGLPLRNLEWKRAGDADEDADWRAQTINTPAALRRIARNVEAHRAVVATPGGMTCRDFGTISRQLVPEARMLSARRTLLDVVIPPLSLAAYYEPPDGDYRFLDRQLALRRCAVMALDGIPGVRIFAVDNEDWLTGDLANYKNPAHLRSAAAQTFLLQAVAHGTHRLTKGNVAAEMALLRSRVLHYRVRDSAVPGFSRDGS